MGRFYLINIFMHNSFSLGKVKNIEIKIHYSWFLIFFLITWSLARFYFPAQYPGLGSFFYWFYSLIAAVLLFASVLFHEMAHSLVGRKNHVIVKSITLFVFGGVAEMLTEPERPDEEFKMAVAGPVASFVLAGAFFVISIAGAGLAISAIAHYLFLINSILVVFNLVPAFPLDGGRIFRSILWVKYKNLDRATRYAVWVSRICALILTLWGIKMLLENNFIGGLWMILISWFLLQAAGASLKQSLMEHVLSPIKVTEIMETNFRSISPKMPLHELAKAFLTYKQGGFPVVEDGRIFGIVTLEDLRTIPQDKWEKTIVKKVMTDAEKLHFLKPKDNAFDAFLKLTNNDLGRLPVVENGEVVGMVTRNSIILLLAVKCDKSI